MEAENVYTFRKNIEELSRSESFTDLLEYFNIIGPRTIEWKRNVPQKIKDRVEYFANEYLV